MFIPKLNSKCVFKYPFDGGKWPLAECFGKKKKRSTFFGLFSYCRFNFYQCFSNKVLEGYSCAHVNDLELKTHENIM